MKMPKEAQEAYEQYLADKDTSPYRVCTFHGGPLAGTTREEQDFVAALTYPANSKGEPATKTDTKITSHLYSREKGTTVFVWKSATTYTRKKGGLLV